MRIKLIASVGVAGLLLVSAPTVASATTTNTVADTPASLIAVDEASPIGSDLLLREFTINDPGKVTSVTISVDFSSSPNNNCIAPSSPGEGGGEGGGEGALSDWPRIYPNELALTLISPAGTRVPLVAEDTYDQDSPTNVRANVLFDDAAAAIVGSNGRQLESGSFQPVTPLAALSGETANGVWSVEMTDADRGAAQCYFGATLNVITDTVTTTLPATPTAPATPPKKIETASR